MEIPYLSAYVARQKGEEIVVVGAPAAEQPGVTIMVLESGRIAFSGSLHDLQTSELSSVRRVLTLDRANYDMQPYFEDPWDKSRVASEKLL